MLVSFLESDETGIQIPETPHKCGVDVAARLLFQSQKGWG